MSKIVSTSVLLISENTENRAMLQAQLDLIGLWGRVVETETLENAVHMTATQQAELCVWILSDDEPNLKLFSESKNKLAQHIIIIGDEQNASLFPDNRFLHVPHKFRELQDQVSATILPDKLNDVLSHTQKIAPNDLERIYRDLFDRGSDANLLLDSETHIIFDANQRALDMYGVTWDEIIGMNMLELIDESEHLNVWNDTKFLQTSKGEPVFVERLDKRKDGSLMHVTVSGSLFEFAGRNIFQDIIRDETERKLAEERRIALRIEQEQVKSLRQFINNTTHDLMTPLSIIKTSLYLCKNTDNEEKRNDKIDKINTQVLRMQQMIEDMMTLTKLDSMTPNQLVIDELDINHTIQYQVKRYQSLLEKHGLTLKTHLPTHNTVLSVHSEYIELVWEKLLDNAIQYTGDEGNIDISIDVDDTTVIFSVTDDGIGIAEDDQVRIFDRFYRVEQHRPSNSGSGLGLTIIKSIVELHQGRIEVLSKKGEGSTFKIFLPRLTEISNNT